MNYPAEKLAQFPWIVSEATHKPEHLLVSYWNAAEQLEADITALKPALERLIGADSRESDWNDAAAAELLEQLTDVLQAAAPNGFTFGSHPGDGACFGFWLDDDWSDALEHCGLNAEDPAFAAEWVARLSAAGVDPDNVEDAYQGRAEGYGESEAGADYAQELASELGLPATLDGDSWPIRCIDWSAAWRELELGDGYWLERLSGAEWLVFRSV